DIRYLVSAASLGTDGAPNSLGNPILPNYVTNFNMHVGGRLGAIETPGSVYGTVDVVNSPTAPSLSGEPITQIANNSISNSWNTADFGLQPGGPGFLNNDTFNSPQILGPINAQGDIVVNGAVQSFSSS